MSMEDHISPLPEVGLEVLSSEVGSAYFGEQAAADTRPIRRVRRVRLHAMRLDWLAVPEDDTEPGELRLVQFCDHVSRNMRQAPQCAICLEDFGDGSLLCRLPGCEHLFHNCCFRPWLRQSVTCPLCRRNLSASVDPQHIAHSVAYSEARAATSDSGIGGSVVHGDTEDMPTEAGAEGDQRSMNVSTTAVEAVPATHPPPLGTVAESTHAPSLLVRRRRVRTMRSCRARSTYRSRRASGSCMW